MSKLFPEVVMGKCPKCTSAPEDNDATEAEADVDDDITEQVPLVWHKGDWICKSCLNKDISDDESELMADKHGQEEEFRANAGFVKTCENE